MAKKNKITELREALGMTQLELAKKADISRVVLSRYENNAPPSKGAIKKLADALGVSVDIITPKVVKAKPLEVENIKELLGKVPNFSEEDQTLVGAVIKTILEKYDLQERLERIKQM